jgi:hypothetical protein
VPVPLFFLWGWQSASRQRPGVRESTYDLGIEQRGRLRRVQVKSRTFQRGETYEINLTGQGGRRHKKGDLDMFAVYVAPVDVWYIGPFEVMERRGTSLQVTPGWVGERYAEYLEAWGLLRGGGSRGFRTLATDFRGLARICFWGSELGPCPSLLCAARARATGAKAHAAVPSDAALKDRSSMAVRVSSTW